MGRKAGESRVGQTGLLPAVLVAHKAPGDPPPASLLSVTDQKPPGSSQASRDRVPG